MPATRREFLERASGTAALAASAQPAGETAALDATIEFPTQAGRAYVLRQV